MHLARLELEEFRGYGRLDLRLDPAGLRLRGANASGKSSLLEAIAMLATTRPARGASDRDVIAWESGEAFGVDPYARIRGEVVRRDGVVEVEIGLQADPLRAGGSRKTIRLNGRPVRAADAVGQLKAVLFSPEDVTLVSGSPAGRRRYLDLAIAQTSGPYLRVLARYQRVLEQRNGLLKMLQRQRAAPSSPSVAGQLAFWDEELAALGARTIAHRVLALDRIASLAAAEFSRLTGAAEFNVGYASTVPNADARLPDHGPQLFERTLTVVHRSFEAELAARRGDEIRRGVSLVGPHRDDVSVSLGDVDLGRFGSRGQQRLAVIALKLAEAAYMTEVAGEPPVLLLDDVLSELDVAHRDFLQRSAVSAAGQVIVTGVQPEDWTGEATERLPAATVTHGSIRPE